MAHSLPRYTLKDTKLLRPGVGSTTVPTTDGRGTGALNYGASEVVRHQRDKDREVTRVRRFQNKPNLPY